MKTKKSRYRIIEQLRRTYPGNWWYDRGSYAQRWVGPDFTVTAYSQATQFEDVFDTIYLRDDTGEHVPVYSY